MLNLTVEGHFLPPSSYCDVCNIRYNYIGKMETFIDDVKFIMTSLNQSSLFQAMGNVQSASDESIISDVVSECFSKLKKTYSCRLRDGILRRLWKHLQIRGILSDSQSYPLGGVGMKSACEIEGKGFLNLAMKAFRRSEDRPSRQAQREKYFLMAFRSVPLNILMRYRDFVKRDCDLFGYDCSPDNIFKGRKEGDEEHNIFSHLAFMYEDDGFKFKNKTLVDR